MLQYTPPGLRGSTLGRGAMAAQQTLDLFILVRVRAPQPGFFLKGCCARMADAGRAQQPIFILGSYYNVCITRINA
jgi:hypothetical protein